MASNLLWAHLRRKDATSSTDTPSQIPPIAPLDKSGTSMRMLIHDTQVNLEMFSTRLDGLLHRVDDCRTQVTNANKLLDVERDKVLTEILEITNRCQTEMKAHVGRPAQAPALDLVQVSQVSTEKSVQALEKRIDALQALLQTQAHALQTIQDQQNAIMSAMLPLVPMIHGISPQIDQIKTALSDTMQNAVSAMAKNVETVRSTLVAEATHRCVDAGSSTRVGSSSRRKRPNAIGLGSEEIGILASSPLVSRGRQHSLKRTRVEGRTHTLDNHSPRKSSRLTTPPTNPREALLQTPRTPRRPLSDLLSLPGVQLDLASHGYMRRSATFQTIGDPSNIATPTSRPPPRPELQHSMIDRRHGLPNAIDEPTKVLPDETGASEVDALSKTIKREDILEANWTDVISVNSSPLSSPPQSLPHPAWNDTNVQPSMPDPLLDDPLFELVQLPPSSDPFSNAAASPPKSMSLRDRRAQISRFGRTRTRRFLPLPWLDEEA